MTVFWFILPTSIAKVPKHQPKLKASTTGSVHVVAPVIRNNITYISRSKSFIDGGFTHPLLHQSDPLYKHDHVKPHPDCPSDPATRLHWAYASRGTELLMIRWFQSRMVDISTSQSAFVWEPISIDNKNWLNYLSEKSGSILSKIIPWPNQAMELYLVWDSESETTKDGTLLTSEMTVEDASSSSGSPSRKRKKSRRKSKSKKKKGSSASSSTEDSEAFWFAISSR